MNIINKIITNSHKFISKYPFILNSIKKIISLCPYLEKKICNTIDNTNTNENTNEKNEEIIQDFVLLTKIGEDIFNIISSPKFKKKAPKKQEINLILNSIDNIFNKKIDKKNALKKLESIIHKDYKENTLKIIAQRAAEYLYEREENYIFMDLSILSRSDSGTGIQRVCKNILKYLPNLSKYKAIPIYSPENEFGKYGFRYCSKLAENKEEEGNEEVIEFIKGDILFFPELSIEQSMGKRDYLQFLKKKGVKIINFIYDLIPITNTTTCTQTIQELFPKFINCVLDYANGSVCDSQSIAKDLKEYIKENRPERINDFKIEWIHLGSDFENSSSSKGLPEDSNNVFNTIESKITFLAVSTIEPRKMYDQILDAFEILWDKDQDINLVIVGKNGWNTEELIEKIENHKEINRRLFKLSGISDEYLNKIYEKSSALIMASKAEGFGLGIIEATYHKKPLIIRDIPVFREIAGENAFYFTGFEGKNLANAIEEWLILYKENKHPKSDNIKYLTWKESVSMLNEKLELITK